MSLPCIYSTMACSPIEMRFLLSVTYDLNNFPFLTLVIDRLRLCKRFWRYHRHTRHNCVVQVSYIIEDGYFWVCGCLITRLKRWSYVFIHRTNTLLNKLILFVVHRGALVTLIQSLLLITFYAAPNHLYWYGLRISSDVHSQVSALRLAFHFNVTKLYANTFCMSSSHFPVTGFSQILTLLVAM